MPFLQNAGQKVNFLFALVTALYLILLAVDFVRYGGVVAPSWITAAFAIALGGWIGCRRSEKPRAPRVFAVLAVVSAAAQIALCCVAGPAYPVSAARAKLAAAEQSSPLAAYTLHRLAPDNAGAQAAG